MSLFLISVRCTLILMLLFGLGYNLLVTGIAQGLMPGKADGSLIYNRNNELVGSELIGQAFADPKYFTGRVSSIDYNGAGSGTPNYAPSNEDMIKRTAEAVEAWKTDNPDVPVGELPIDLITNSGSGLDPHISPEAAEAQIPRISKLTGIAETQLADLVRKHTSGRQLGFLGEPTVNVLKLNLELDAKMNQ
ncbi:potassium-transporting ATPase subunit KdpC [Paenibacillus arenilitoris]|uniref:Potassium-transporting ATPase KdpC subunit n=1 Tax=Paenibacillus arenilitoris TaxID=2772299 RepID=A0A927CME7_9BACL|nr:potassium-transporting ATPase subunit KdpC [Paenibacillus arenilitoris]MBD2870234.1 potassium-transporting ATPase subunit KdpC [Paenibacillus arenilitoris]